MYFILYISNATADINEYDFKSILESARNNNQASGITGLLLYSKGKFIQYIEGESRKSLEMIYNKIIQDPRHCDLEVIIQGETKDRMFSDWEMGFCDISDNDSLELPGGEIIPNKAEDIRNLAQQPNLAARFLYAFFENSAWSIDC